MGEFFSAVGSFFVALVLFVVAALLVFAASVGSEALDHPDCSYNQIADHSCRQP